MLAQVHFRLRAKVLARQRASASWRVVTEQASLLEAIIARVRRQRVGPDRRTRGPTARGRPRLPLQPHRQDRASLPQKMPESEAGPRRGPFGALAHRMGKLCACLAGKPGGAVVLAQNRGSFPPLTRPSVRHVPVQGGRTAFGTTEPCARAWPAPLQ